MFTLDTSATSNPPLVGPITAGTMTGGPGSLVLPWLIAGTEPIYVSLIGARVAASGLSATALGETTGVQPSQMSTAGVTFGGGIPASEIDSTVPGITTGLNNIVTDSLRRSGAGTSRSSSGPRSRWCSP